MAKGPRLNNISKKFTTRDSLGIEGVATSISAEICPIVNTVTPRPFYWAFIAWGFYDFYKNHKAEERSISNVYKYIKMQNYFLALASNINGIAATNGYTGAENIKKKVNLNQEEFNYEESYIKTMLSNMIYYPAGLYTMKFLAEEDPITHQRYKYPHMTPLGEKLAKSFDTIISKTEYYQKYRFIGRNVPRDVLIKLGNAISNDLTGFEETKSILRNSLFNTESTRKLIQCHNYLKFVFQNEEIEYVTREVFYDYYSPKSKIKKEYPSELREIINSWEIIIGRQYFTTGLGMIWKFMLESLNTLKTREQWFQCCFKESKFSFNLKSKLSSLLDSCNYDFNERELMIANARSDKTNHENNIENGIKIILSVYNRFVDRNDFSKENSNYLNYGIESNSISLNNFFELVDSYKDKTIEDFIKYIMHNYLLEQHLNTAFKKMVQDDRDGYYIEKMDNEYIRKEYFRIEFQGIRMVQLTSVMRDFSILGDK